MSEEIDPRLIAFRDQAEAAARDTSNVLREGGGGYTANVEWDELLGSPFGAVAAFIFNAWCRHGGMTCSHITGPTAGATLLPLSSPPCLLCTRCTWEVLGRISHSQFAGSCDVCGRVEEDNLLSYRFVQFEHVVILVGLCERCVVVVSSPARS